MDVFLLADYMQMTDERALARSYVLTAGVVPGCRRIDLVLFFISPHVLRPMSIDYLACLSELAPVVPILAKVGFVARVQTLSTPK
jgi:hypothetical protein